MGLGTHVSGTAVKISSSSCWSSESVFVGSSLSSWEGSQEATRRWLRDRATFARLRIMSDSDFERDIFAEGRVLLWVIWSCWEVAREASGLFFSILPVGDKIVKAVT